MENLIPTLKLTNGALYVAPRPKGKTVRRALELLEELDDSNLDEQDVDQLAQFLCDLYDNKCGINDIYNGISRDDVLKTILSCIQAAVGMFVSASKKGNGHGQTGGPPITSIEALNNLYREIMKIGWTLHDMDESDFFALMGLLVKPEEKHYIDELF